MSFLDDSTSLSVAAASAGVGWVEPEAFPNPAPGVLVVPRVIGGDYWERVICGRITFTADATVGTRNPRFQLLDGQARVLYEANLSTGVVASTSITASVSVYGNIALAAAGFTQAAIPDVLLPSGYTARFVVDGVGAADAFSNGILLMGRYPSSAVRSGAAG